MYLCVAENAELLVFFYFFFAHFSKFAMYAWGKKVKVLVFQECMYV